VFRGLVPEDGLHVVERSEEIADGFRRTLRAFRGRGQGKARRGEAADFELIKALQELIRLSGLQASPTQMINEVPKKKAAKFREWVLRLAAEAKEGGRVAKKGSLPEPMDAFARSLKEVIGSTYYVGPHREKPRLYQGQAGQAQPLHVGAAGESTASVLLKGWGDPTTYVPPPTGSNLVFEADRAVSLGVALNEWVNYLAVAEEVTVEQAGKLGISLKVREAAAGRTTDLTGVGVGVSQVLPILVQGLAAPPLSTLILEQPELHLHPSLQSRLCDFFVSLVMSYRQVIFETHSDHIVNRMRLHTILGNLRENIDVSLYFLEKPAGSTGSSVRPIRIGSGGSFSDWPEGFCDEHDRVLDRIVEASFAAKKRGGSR
jgi:hypothetical protein